MCYERNGQSALLKSMSHHAQEKLRLIGLAMAVLAARRASSLSVNIARFLSQLIFFCHKAADSRQND